MAIAVWYIMLMFLVAAAVAVIVTWRVGQGRGGEMPAPIQDRPGPDLLGPQIDADELRRLKFAVVTRGYDMAQVDAVLDLLVQQLEATQNLHELMTSFGGAASTTATAVDVNSSEPDGEAFVAGNAAEEKETEIESDPGGIISSENAE